MVLGAPVVECLYAHLGQAYTFQQAWKQAQDAYQRASRLCAAPPAARLVSLTLNLLAILAVQQSHNKLPVQALLEEAWRMTETSRDQQALVETEWDLAQIIAIVWDALTSSLTHGEHVLELAQASHDKELEARSRSTFGVIHILRGDFEEAMPYLETSLGFYIALDTEPGASRELSLAHFLIGAPPTQPLANLASEAMCCAFQAFAQVNSGQVQQSIRSSHRALTIVQESKNIWVHIYFGVTCRIPL
ncbi:hypothetical protein [Dictyobacter formicarum]|uniref:MalT-like TPR region domain-containing protein n=1 Tax=Dictyobacter formicarum TaxID=2778368 RepID=A0ABQ3VMR7_9CHLR|nr:hypothetical protein [Dictyobacter formicarum]GHO87004.1 hypothetical protein KSZ_50100 [Dictyobacter formicarum]